MCLLFLPTAIVAQPESANKIIIRAMGIDKTEEGYEVTAIAFTPQSSQTFGENYKVIEGKGDSLYTALISLGNHAGKEVALAHADVIVVDEKASAEGLIEAIDYLNREYSLGNDAHVMYCPSSTSELIRLVNELGIGSEIRLGKISTFDEEKIINGNSNIESIYNSAYSPSKCTLVNVVELSEDEGLDPNVSGASGGSGGSSDSGGPGGASGGSSGGGEQQKKKVLNEGKAMVFKEGKRALLLSKEEVQKYRFMRSSRYAQTFTVKNFSDANFTDANITFTSQRNDVSFDLSFDGETPVCKIVIKPVLQISEVNQKILDSDIYLSPYKFATKELETEVEKQISSDAKFIVEKFNSENLDLFQIYEKFNAKLTKQFQNYLQSLENEDEYLKGIHFEYVCDSQITN